MKQKQQLSPNNDFLTQGRIEKVNKAFKDNESQFPNSLPSLVSPEQEITNAQVLDAIFDFRGFSFSSNTDSATSLHSSRVDKAPLVFLASVAKVVITMLMLQEVGAVESLSCDKRIILELIGLSSKPDTDARFLYRLFETIGSQYKLNEEYRNLFVALTQLNLDESLKLHLDKLLANKTFTLSEVDIILTNLSDLLAQDNFEVSYNLSIEELVQLTLTLSSNATTQLFRELIGQDRIQKLAEQVLPNYHPTITTSGAFHWVQEDANIGRIEEFGSFLHSLISKPDKSKAEVAILDAIKNNPNDFGFDFANSGLGRSLIREGWSIYEKTGYYPLVNWVEDLSNQGFPAHMSLCSIFSIVKGGHIFTFAFSMSIGIKLGDAMLEEEITIDGQKVKFQFIDTKSKEKSDYYKRIKSVAGEIFRARLGEAVLEFLPIN